MKMGRGYIDMKFNVNYYQKEMTCHFCKKLYKTYKARPNRCKIIKEDTDFMPIYKDLNPLLYEVAVCPHCGYAYHHSMTRTYGPFLLIIEQLYIEELQFKPDLCAERTIDDALMSYKLAYLVAKAAMEEPLLLGNFALKMAWLYRLQNNTRQELHYLKAAREFYSQSFAKNKEGEERIKYLHAELSLRIGDIDEARKGFSRILGDRNISNKYRKYARNRWEDYRHDYKEQEGEKDGISI